MRVLMLIQITESNSILFIFYIKVGRRRMKVVKRPRIKPEPLPAYVTSPENSYQAPHPGIPTAYVAPARQNSYHDVDIEKLPTITNDDTVDNPDLSYSFRVKSENSSREEIVDEDGERTGSYRSVFHVQNISN